MPTPDLQIRPYERRDREAVLAVHAAAFQGSGFELDPDGAIAEELRTVTETYLDGGHTFMVGLVDGAVVATGGYRAGSGDDAEVGHLRVHPGYQRRGYARVLMTELEKRAKADGFDRFVLETHEDLPAARNLYDALGYTVTERRPHEVTGGEMVHYAKEL